MNVFYLIYKGGIRSELRSLKATLSEIQKNLDRHIKKNSKPNDCNTKPINNSKGVEID